MTKRSVIATWEKALGAPLGPVLGWLVERMQDDGFRRDAEEHLMLDPPTADRLTPLSQQKRLGLFVLGRTSRGLFGVERSSDITPLDARPVFSAPFQGTTATRVADHFARFLASTPELAELLAHAPHPPTSSSTLAKAKKAPANDAATAKPRRTPPSPAPKTDPATNTASSKDATAASAKGGSAARGKLAPKQAIALAKQLEADVIRRQGVGVALLFFTDDIHAGASRGTLEVQLLVNAPSDTDPALLDDPLPRRVAEALRVALGDATGHDVDVVLGFDMLDTGSANGRAHLERLASIVARTGDRDAEAYVRRLARA